MHYVKNKKNKIDTCNLCLKNTELTWDHVPPKGSVELSPVEMRDVMQSLHTPEFQDRTTISQDGVKFRTICSSCNGMLGKEYDPVLNEFSKSIGQHLKSTLNMPSEINLNIKPQRLVRAVLGHLVSAKVEIDGSRFDELVRSFIREKDLALPEDINVFYWVFPYSYQAVARDLMMPSIRGSYRSFSVFQAMKFFPVAFVVTDTNQYENLPCLTHYRNEKLDMEVEIKVNLRNIKPPDWPDAAEGSNFVAFGRAGADSIFAVPRGGKKSLR